MMNCLNITNSVKKELIFHLSSGADSLVTFLMEERLHSSKFQLFKSLWIEPKMELNSIKEFVVPDSWELQCAVLPFIFLSN